MQSEAKSKKQFVSEFRRSEIITAARSVFAQKGYLNATVDEIALAAGLAKGTIYVYFNSKEEIYTAAIENDLEILRQRTLQNIAAAGTVLEKISAYINSRFDYCEERRDFFRITYFEPAGPPTSPLLSKVRAREWLREPVNQLALAIQSDANYSGILPWQAEALAWAVADLTTGALQRRLGSTPATTARQDADFLIGMVYAALSNPSMPISEERTTLA